MKQRGRTRLALLLAVCMLLTAAPLTGIPFAMAAPDDSGGKTDPSGYSEEPVSTPGEDVTPEDPAAVKWELAADGTLTVSGTGEMTFENAWEIPWSDRTEEIKAVVIGSGLTTVAVDAFRDCPNLTSVTLPDGLTGIGRRAFYGCGALQKINVPDTVTEIGESAFEGCAALGNLTLPDSVEKIGSAAFAGCTSFTAFRFPAGVTEIVYATLYGCAGIRELNIPAAVQSVSPDAFGCTKVERFSVDPENAAYSAAEGVLMNKDQSSLVLYPMGRPGASYTAPTTVRAVSEYAFYENGILNAVTLQAGVAEIGDRAFSKCAALRTVSLPAGLAKVGESAFRDSGLTEVTLPESATELGRAVFSDCSDLTRARLSDGMTEIPADTFYKCASLTEVNIPKAARRIGYMAFRRCASLPAVTFPEGLQSVAEMAFEGCVSLRSLSFPDSVAELGEAAFSGCEGLVSLALPAKLKKIRGYCFANCVSLPAVKIPAGIESYGSGVFHGCTALKDVTLPAGMDEIPYGMFEGCTGLPAVDLPQNLQAVGSRAFAGCSGLTEVTLPETVTDIVYSSFERCDGLTEFHIPASVKNIGTYAFYRCAGMTAFTVAEANADYTAEDGVLMTKDKTELVQYPAAKDLAAYTVPATVKEIRRGAFAGCVNLKSLTVPGAMTEIPAYAFSDIDSLTDATVQEGVTSIGYGAFSGCPNLLSVLLPASVTQIRGWVFPENVVIHAPAGSYAQTWAEENGYAFLPVGGAGVSLVAPGTVNEKSFSAHGFATPGADVTVTADGKTVAAATASARGAWEAVVTLADAKDGAAVELKASVTAEGKTAQAAATVTYRPLAVLREEFTMAHNYADVTVNGNTVPAAARYFTVVPGQPFSFRVRVTNEARVKTLSVVSTKNGERKAVSLIRSAADGSWVGAGLFDEKDPNYVPGALTVEGTDMDGASFVAGEALSFLYLIDPSGFVYEAVRGNTLAGVTARIYAVSEDGTRMLWDAEKAGQLNPQKTTADGAFAWDVPEGKWQIGFSHPGYSDAWSEVMTVPPIRTNVLIPMSTNQSPSVLAVNVYADHADVVFDQYMTPESVNAQTVQFDGYTGSCRAVDPVPAGDGSDASYAKIFRFTPDKAFSGKVHVTVYGATNYVGYDVWDSYEAFLSVQAEPKNLTAAASASVAYGESFSVEISAENAAGKTVTVTEEGALLTLSARELKLDENGKATLQATAGLPGETKLVFTLDGTTLQAGTAVKVALPAPVYTLGDVNNSGKVDSADARLALRIAVGLEPAMGKGTPEYTAANVAEVAKGVVNAADARLILRKAVNIADPDFGK